MSLLQLAGLVLLVALILVGALMPLKYTARMHLPKQPVGGGNRQDGDRAASGEACSRDE
jgi:hypothetical protein